MLAFFADYGLFVAKLATLVAIVLAVASLLIASTKRGMHPDGLLVEHLNRRFEDLGDAVRRAVHGKEKFKRQNKERRKEIKQLAKKGSQRKRIYVLDFKGDIRASATASLREEISAVLAVATEEDEVLVRLENAGGAVHEHGLAASQLLRVVRRGIPLTVSVDKVAASGGYLMACVANRIVAAPFAIIGSVGVIAQLPNFHRWLDEKGVDFEQVTAGRFKRTLTVFGKNTEEGREKLREELEEVHELFKVQIAEHRPEVDLEQVATGEHWYGVRALELGLIDELRTSDDFLVDAAEDHDLYRITFKRRRPLPERLLSGAEGLLSR
ncbi:MAG: protease SohB [Thermoleophilia bacterium]|nr:protease SohB [Thermoleophilia bacterium]